MSLADAIPPAHNQSGLAVDAEQSAGELSDQPQSPEANADHAPVDQDEEMEDLFGNEDEDAGQVNGQAASPEGSANDSERIGTPEAEHRRALEYEEEDEPGGVVQQIKEADVSFPNIPLPKSSDGDHWVIKMPNYVAIDSKPFHPDTYMGPEQDEESGLLGGDLREQSNVIHLKVANTLRWRWLKDENGVERRQSNSRVIRWSDGSLSLRLGKELFDINQQIDSSAGVPRSSYGGSRSQSQSQSQSAPSQAQSAPAKSQGLTYLVAQHKRAQVLQAEALVTGTLSLRPTGMQSETHRMLVKAVAQRHSKVARLRMTEDPERDPERDIAELAKASARKSKKRAEEDGLGGGRRKGRRYGRKSAAADVWSDEDEEPQWEPSEDEELDAMAARARKAAAREDGRKGGDYQEDDFVVADEEEEEEGGSDGERGKRKRKDDGEEDDLDKLESKIQAQAAEERKRRRKDAEDAKEDAVDGNADADADADAEEQADADEGMEIESEDDEEEFKVRRAGAGGRRKRAIEFEEEEE